MSPRPRPHLSTALLAAGLALGLVLRPAGARASSTDAERSASDTPTRFRTATVDGVELFFREAGPANAPLVVLLHGFPSSSRMFRRLMPALADRFHVVAPDYPAFGHSAVPDRVSSPYTFARFAELVDGLLAQLGARRYALYVQDYGAPVGYRLALLHPERVTALVVQNGNAYTEGLREFWQPIRAYWADPSPEHRRALRAGLTPEATRAGYLHGVEDPSRVDPDCWLVDQTLLDRPGVDEIMLDLFLDYRTNVALYPRFQEFFRTWRPPTLVVWGRNDEIFPAEGARAYLRDLPGAELHLLDTGHFALEDRGEEIAALMRSFFARNLPRR